MLNSTRWLAVMMVLFVLMLQVVNAFGVQSDAEMKAKVITRLCNMSDMHQLLNKSLVGNVHCVWYLWFRHCLQLLLCMGYSAIEVNTYKYKWEFVERGLQIVPGR